MAPHSSILAWEIPWTEKSGGLPSMGSQRVRHNSLTKRQKGATSSGHWMMLMVSSEFIWIDLVSLGHFLCVRLFATPWTAARHAPLCMGFSRQQYWSGVPFPPPGDLPTQGSDPGLPHCRQILYCLNHQGSLTHFIVPLNKYHHLLCYNCIWFVCLFAM